MLTRGKTLRWLLLAGLVGLLGLGLMGLPYGGPHGAGASAADQGCVNQGRDRRVAATLICAAQRRLSWKSDREPRFWLLGNPARTSLGLAWPPYLVYNSPAGNARWRMFRVGFRYDRTWRGYIFPTIAWKLITHPLRY